MTTYIYKIFDDDCPVCQSMTVIENEIEGEHGIAFPKLSLNHATYYVEVFQYLCTRVAEDNTLEMPVYLRVDETGTPVEHLCGAQSYDSLLELCKSTL